MKFSCDVEIPVVKQLIDIISFVGLDDELCWVLLEIYWKSRFSENSILSQDLNIQNMQI